MIESNSRRDALKKIGAAGLGGLLLPAGFAWGADRDKAFWDAPRRLKLFRPQTKEFVNEVYWADGALNELGYIKICNLLRDVQANKAVYMDPRLLDLMCAVQGYMAFYGFDRNLNIHSGYRSPQTNEKTEGAAKKSKHLNGQAVDFDMPGVPSSYMGALASHYKGGGVGFYPDNGFTHMDTGDVRYWGKNKLLIR